MVVLLRKKKELHPSHVRGSIIQCRPPRNQLVETVAPFDELPSFDSFRIKNPFSARHQKYSSQREQLAKLKVMNLESALGCAGLDNSPWNTGLSTTPVRTNAETFELEQPIKLVHQGISCKSSKLSAMTTKTANRIAFKSTMDSAECKERILFTDNFGGGGTMVGCATGAHRVPCIISITPLNDYDGDTNSEISLEELLCDTASFLTSADPSTLSQEANYTNASAAFASSVTKSSFFVDWNSTDSSISWPSDEEDEEPQLAEKEELLLNRPSTLRMITAMQDLTFSDNGSDSQSYFKPQLACGGFKFWSEEEIQKRKRDFRSTSATSHPSAAAARDEEDSRVGSGNDKDREGNLETATFRE